MPPKTGKNKEYYKNAGELRKSQTVRTFGPGAIIDLPHFSGLVMGIDNWDITKLPTDGSAKLNEGVLQRYHGKDFFYQPMSENKKNDSFGIPVIRYPYYYYCPECNMLDHYYKIGKTQNRSKVNCEDLYCNNCGTKVKLIPSRFIVACQNGHIDDFPYGFWVHRGKEDCGKDTRLTLKYNAKTGGLDGITVKCETCGAVTTMAGCMSKDALKGIKCKGKMPWIEKKYKDPEDCQASLRTMQRSANNVYYPVNHSALTIPPWSSKIHKVIKKHVSKLEDFFDHEKDTREILLSSHYKKYGNEYGCSFDIFRNEVTRAFGAQGEEQDVTEESIIEDEYRAFSGADINDPYFRTELVNLPSEFSNLFEQVKLVHRLREVEVIRGFRRVFSDKEKDEVKKKEEGLMDREFTPLSKQPLNWLPAIELFGEGIFIKFNEERIKEWELENRSRYLMLAKRLENNWLGNNKFSENTVRYVMLHTFSHLVIRQLTSDCGYSSASLKEKIYSTFNGSSFEMSGILIYTATSDTDGSLGGLVRQGRTENLRNTLFNMLEESSWCSNDPLCIDSNAQGYKSLNYSACHACTLLPETSCEAFNCLLDRASIVGKPDNRNIGYFKECL